MSSLDFLHRSWCKNCTYVHGLLIKFDNGKSEGSTLQCNDNGVSDYLSMLHSKNSWGLASNCFGLITEYVRTAGSIYSYTSDGIPKNLLARIQYAACWGKCQRQHVNQHRARGAGEAVVGTALAWLPTTLLDGHFTNIRWRLYFVGKTFITFILNNPVPIYS